MGAAATAASPPAAATEEQWRLGGNAGYWMVGLTEATVGGLGGGAHLTYGISDAFNLRLNGDLTWLSRPPPLSYALIWNGSFGAEYVVDILEWVPTLGVMAGPVGIYRDAERHDVYLGLEIPGALSYHVTEGLALGVEARYRLLIVGTDVGPLSQLALLLRGEYAFAP